MDGPNICYDGPSIARVSGADAAARVQIPSAASSFFTFDATHMYFVANLTGGTALARVLKTSLPTGQPERLASFGSGTLGPMAVDAQYLYYALNGDGIYRLPKTGGMPARIAVDNNVIKLVASGGAIYWANGGTSGSFYGAVRKLVL